MTDLSNYDTSDYTHEPRILIFDIECTPFVAYSWGPKFNVNLIDFIEDWHLLSFAYKWLGEDEVHVVSQRQFKRDYKRNRRDDRRVAQELWKLLDEADIVVAHNGARFDTKKSNARFAVHGLGRPSPYYVVDTLHVAKRSFNFGSNSLNDLAKFLGLGAKLQHTGFDLWLGCMAGKNESWQTMEDYNVQDVALLEKLYLRFRDEGWIVNHPNLGTISGRPSGCPACGSSKLVQRGYRSTSAYRYPRYRCSDCGSWSRGAKSEQGSYNNSRTI